MKKKLISMVFLILVCSCVACGAKEDENVNDKVSSDNSPTATSTPTPITANDDIEDEKAEEVYTTRAPGQQIFIDYSVTLNRTEEPYATLMYDKKQALVGFTYDVYNEYTGTLEDVLEHLGGHYLNVAHIESSGSLKDSEITVTSSEKVTIAGQESIRFTGIAPNNNGWDCHVYGYTFLINNVPCGVIGIVSVSTQDASLIEEINAQVDTIAATIRTEK